MTNEQKLIVHKLLRKMTSKIKLCVEQYDRNYECLSLDPPHVVVDPHYEVYTYTAGALKGPVFRFKEFRDVECFLTGFLAAHYKEPRFNGTISRKK